MSKIGYLGPEGSYSCLAAKTFRPDAEFLAYGSFNLVIQALIKGECDEAVLPIENSLNGGVNQNMDLLQCTENIVAFRECSVKIDHRLATLSGAAISGISRIYSHQQALEQCNAYLCAHFPKAQVVAVSSTAASLEMLKSPADACIVGAHVARDGVTLSKENIADEKFNVTHFLLVRRGVLEEDARSQKIYFSATCRHEPGALLNLLNVVKELNMTKIQSRPIKDKPGEYRFFIEVDGDYSKSDVKAVLKRVENSANSFKIIGAY